MMSPGIHDYAHGETATANMHPDVEWIEPADIFTVRNGLIVHMQADADPDRAFVPDREAQADAEAQALVEGV